MHPIAGPAALQPWKAKRESWTEPAHVRQVAEKLASLRGMSVEEVEAATEGNLRRLLGLGLYHRQIGLA